MRLSLPPQRKGVWECVISRDSMRQTSFWGGTLVGQGRQVEDAWQAWWGT